MISTNLFVQINSTDIYCTLLNGSGYSSCNITYEVSDNCTSNQYDIPSCVSAESSMESIQFNAVTSGVTICYVAIASNLTSTVILKGTYTGDLKFYVIT